MSRARSIRVAISMLLVTATGLAERSVNSQARTGQLHGQWGACGIERWAVKTLQDRPRLLPTKHTTIAQLIAQAHPSKPSDRTPYERHVFTVSAAVTLDRPEADQDFHLVLQDTAGRTMIAESTSPMCDTTATPARKKQIALVHNEVRVCSKATITGVAFFDFFHHQTGVAPNVIELHPILGFRCLTS